jgi:hypothetical protein
MTSGRIIPQKVPICPGVDSLFRIRHNNDVEGNPWWVFYGEDSGDLIPADDPHQNLVRLVNELKQQQGGQAGGRFSMNEHCQVIARMQAPVGVQGQAVHVVGVRAGTVVTYRTPITFRNGSLNPEADADEGQIWPGPRCGVTYKFCAPGNAQQPSGNFEEVSTLVGGQVRQLSSEASIARYPPNRGLLAQFLLALRRQLPNGGRFRVNEQRRAFTSNSVTYIGTVPLEDWFKPITARS